VVEDDLDAFHDVGNRRRVDKTPSDHLDALVHGVKVLKVTARSGAS